jgi:hypothetical protein
VVTARWNTGKLALYPNPAASTLFLSGVAGPVQYRVFNGQGKALLSGETTGTTGVDLKALPAGVYLLEVVSEGSRKVQQFVRQ